MNNISTVEQAELFEQEAISAYEKALARNLVASLKETEKLRKFLELALDGQEDADWFNDAYYALHPNEYSGDGK